MTDLTPDDILRVARAVCPDIPWQLDDMHGIVYDPRDGTAFDPLNSNADAFSVLAWLMSGCASVEFEALSGEKTLTVYPMVDPDNYSRFTLDGTEAGLRRAITQAAARVA